MDRYRYMPLVCIACGGPERFRGALIGTGAYLFCNDECRERYERRPSMENETQPPPPTPGVSPPDPAATPATSPPEHIMQFFAWDHLPEHLQDVSAPFARLANQLVQDLPRNPERTVALRKLLEAKDAAVRAKLAK